jgi:hypothetical protein
MYQYSIVIFDYFEKSFTFKGRCGSSKNLPEQKIKPLFHQFGQSNLAKIGETHLTERMGCGKSVLMHQKKFFESFFFIYIFFCRDIQLDIFQGKIIIE